MGCEESNIKRFFEKHALPGVKCEVVKVIIGWDIRQFRDFQEKQRLLGKKYFALLKQGFDETHPQVLAVKHEFGQIVTELRNIRSGGSLVSSGTCIVVLAKQQDHR